MSWFRNVFLILLNFLPALLWAGLIYVFSSQSTLPGPAQDTLNFLFKKSAHLFVYAVLYILVYWGLLRSVKPTGKYIPAKLLFLPLFICLSYAVFDEFHQSQVVGRHATFRDVGYDFLGSSIVLLRLFKYV